ncbi:hypothetical protein CCHL11_09313 [Colletotrichum chlorophyti]|uniref:Uncharacterized protein n=1 Tax=Colletotrichum chlorophyti TaxID=708187 RepID=A0A1Q8RSS4_9PEZI|nr:hypothetical protein CCHL11_09313 [Colletotrichum chlorophyti]
MRTWIRCSERIAGQVAELVKDQTQGVQQKHGKLLKSFSWEVSAVVHIFITIKSKKLLSWIRRFYKRTAADLCRGAVVHGLVRSSFAAGLSMAVLSRIARVNYGTSLWTIFSPKVHLRIDRVWDEHEMKRKGKNQVESYLKQIRSMTIAPSLVQTNTYPTATPACTTSRPAKQSRELNILHHHLHSVRKVSNVRQLFNITWNKRIDFQSLSIFTNFVEKFYHRLEWVTEMVTDGRSLEFTVFHDRKRVAAQSVSLDFDEMDEKDASA